MESPQALRVCWLILLQVAGSVLEEIRRLLPRIQHWVRDLPPLGKDNLAALPGVVPALALVENPYSAASFEGSQAAGRYIQECEETMLDCRGLSQTSRRRATLQHDDDAQPAEAR
jgi:hypothetical protein